MFVARAKTRNFDSNPTQAELPVILTLLAKHRVSEVLFSTTKVISLNGTLENQV